MTRQYVEKAELEWVERDDLSGWVDSENPDTWFLPPMNINRSNLVAQVFDLRQPIFAGFPGEPGENGVFLDNQYMYHASKFLDLSGSHWQVYRKNIKKYPARMQDERGLVYRRLKPHAWEDDVATLMASWAEGQILQDPEVFIRFVLFGSHRWGLFCDGKLVGLNVGDVNPSGVAVYRYCIDDGTPYLNEYLRHRFYTSQWAQERGWVNDGGDLGNEGLARFKRKLNPIEVLPVYSHAPNEGGTKSGQSPGKESL